MAAPGDIAASALVFAGDGALEFDNLHVDLGPELAEEVTGIDWVSDDSMLVSVHFPVDGPADSLIDLPPLHQATVVGGDWWF